MAKHIEREVRERFCNFMCMIRKNTKHDMFNGKNSENKSRLASFFVIFVFVYITKVSKRVLLVIGKYT